MLPDALHPRLEFAVAVLWLLLAAATTVEIAQDSALLAALTAWMGGFLSPYVLGQGARAYRKARAA